MKNTKTQQNNLHGAKRQYDTRLRDIFAITKIYHIIVYKGDRKVGTSREELEGVIDYLKWNDVKIIDKAYHNDGEHGDLHVHIIGEYAGLYKKLKYPTFMIKFWQQITSNQISKLQKYIHRGAKLSHRPGS